MQPAWTVDVNGYLCKISSATCITKIYSAPIIFSHIDITCPQHQMTLDLMGINQNAFLLYSSQMTEEICFESCQNRKAFLICRLICNKRKFVAFYKGDLDTAGRMYELGEKFPTSASGEFCLS